LIAGKSIERELSGGKSHSYSVIMTSGQYLQIVVEQRGMNVVVVVFTPDGKQVCEVDSDQAIEGTERASLIAEATGAYLIEESRRSSHRRADEAILSRTARGGALAAGRSLKAGSVVDLETEPVASAVLLGRLRPAGRVEIIHA